MSMMMIAFYYFQSTVHALLLCAFQFDVSNLLVIPDGIGVAQVGQ